MLISDIDFRKAYRDIRPGFVFWGGVAFFMAAVYRGHGFIYVLAPAAIELGYQSAKLMYRLLFKRT